MTHKEESTKTYRRQKGDFYFGVVPMDAKCLSTASKLLANSKKRKPESDDDCSFKSCASEESMETEDSNSMESSVSINPKMYKVSTLEYIGSADLKIAVQLTKFNC